MKVKLNKKTVKENKFFFFLLLPLVVSLFGLTAINLFLVFEDTETVLSQSGRRVAHFHEDNTIYEKVECQYCECQEEGGILFAFLGSFANCLNLDSQDERFKCFAEYSYPRHLCGDLDTSSKIEECISQFHRYKEAPYEYYLGEGGTFINKRGIDIGGSRTYLAGFEGGEHNFYTGLDSTSHNPITFIEDSRNVIFNRDLSPNYGVNIGSSYGGIFLNTDVSMGSIEYAIDQEDDDDRMKIITGITELTRDRGIGAQRKVDDEEFIYIQTGSKNIMTFDPAGRKVSFKKGSQIRSGDIKSLDMYLQDRHLRWTPPIRGNFILYYSSAQGSRPDIDSD